MITLDLYSKKYKSITQKMYGEAFHKLTCASIYQIFSFFRIFKSSLYICLRNDNIVIGGAAIIRKFNHHTFRLETWVAGVYVENQFRHQNYGTKIMHSLLNICKDKRYNEINLYVDKNNHNACKLYDKIGFRIIGTYKNYFHMNYIINVK